MDLPERERLKAFILRFIQQGTSTDFVPVAAEHQMAFRALFGVLQRVRLLAQAHVRLTKEGFGPVSQVLVRAALEHAATAQWAFYTRGGVARMEVSIARDQYNLAIGVGIRDEEFLKPRRDIIPAGKGMPDWALITEDVDDDTHFVQYAYRVLSQAVHVTHSAMAEGFHVADDGEISLVMRPEDPYEHQVLYTLAGSCMLAAWLFAVMSDDHDEQVRLQSIGSDLHMPWTLEQNIPARKRRIFVEDSPPVVGGAPDA